MPLLAGTSDGVYRLDALPADDAVRTLDSDRAMRVRTFDGRAYAATRSGLYRSTDGGRAWTRLETPREEVYSVLEHPVGARLYAGTHPAHLYVSTDDGATWTESEGLQALPSRDSWHTPRHRDEAHVRALRPAGPDRLVAGIEVGGVHLSEDAGDTWTERRGVLHDDVHHVLVTADDTWLASTGDGLYRTDDAGGSWTRLDGDDHHRYFREAYAQDGRLYAAAASGPPPSWDGGDGADAALYESTDGGQTLRQVDYPGGPGEVVLSWTGLDDTVVAGTSAGGLIRRTDEGWTSAGRLPASVRSLATVE